MDILVAEPHGMCTGVDRALRIARRTLDDHPGETLWCFHEIVHNEHVVAELRARGARFVSDIEEIPEGARVLFSAHGVSPAVREAAAARQLEVVDATCPFVAKVHIEARNFSQKGIPMVLIGHKGHDEVIGVLGEATVPIVVAETAEDTAALAARGTGLLGILSQTTISHEMFDARVAELKAAGFRLQLPDRRDICYATTERQRAVRRLAEMCDRVIVIGSRNSSNSKRLAEVARAAGCPADLIASPDELNLASLAGVRRLGLTSGASTPEALLDALRRRLTRDTFDNLPKNTP